MQVLDARFVTEDRVGQLRLYVFVGSIAKKIWGYLLRFSVLQRCIVLLRSGLRPYLSTDILGMHSKQDVFTIMS
jgi:hypothetical protein